MEDDGLMRLFALHRCALMLAVLMMIFVLAHVAAHLRTDDALAAGMARTLVKSYAMSCFICGISLKKHAMRPRAMRTFGAPPAFVPSVPAMVRSPSQANRTSTCWLLKLVRHVSLIALPLGGHGPPAKDAPNRVNDHHRGGKTT